MSNKALKAHLKLLYQKYGIDGTAKASDITRFGFKTRACKIPTDNGRVNGLILSLVKILLRIWLLVVTVALEIIDTLIFIIKRIDKYAERFYNSRK